MATSATCPVHGITWTWEEDLTVGSFANGSKYVVLPSGVLTLTAITPADAAPGDATHLNGTMINPTGASWNNEDDLVWFTQGWDSRSTQSTYDEDLNIARQLSGGYEVTLGGGANDGASIVSCTSKVVYPYGDGGNPSFMDRASILTVLKSAPAAGSFRPTIQGVDKTIRWNKSNIDYTRLQNLAPVSGAPTLTTETDCGYNNGGYIGHFHQLPGSNSLSPYFNLPIEGGNYGPQHQQQSTLAALLLNLDYPDATKENLAIHFIQWGLDCFSYLENTRVMYAGNGGQMGGRKLPMCMAGVLLNDADIISMCSERGGWTSGSNRMRFAENHQFQFITSGQIGFLDYTADEVGRANWAANWEDAPTSSQNVWGTSGASSYRNVTNHQWLGTALAVRIMGISDEWDGLTTGSLGAPYEGAFMDYYAPDGHYHELYALGSGFVDPWIETMYSAYWGLGLPTPLHSVENAGTPRSSYSLDSERLVTLTASGGVDEIYYTINGDAPTDTASATNFLYSAPFTVSAAATVKWKGFAAGSDPSAEGSITISFVTEGHPCAPVNLAIS